MAELNVEDVVKIMKSERFVMLSCVAADGSIHSHPMTPQEVTDDAQVVFFIGKQGEQAEELKANPAVNLAFAETGSWLSVAGTASFEDDRQTIDRLYNSGVDAWFSGKDDPNLGLLRITPDSAQYWGTPGGKLTGMWQIAKSMVTGQKPDGESRTTEL